MGTRFFAYSHRMSFPTRVRLKGSPEVTNYFLFDHPPGVSPKALDWNAAEPPKVNPIVFLDRVAPQPSAECLDNDSCGNPESSSV
jgi:hypothetical protein